MLKFFENIAFLALYQILTPREIYSKKTQKLRLTVNANYLSYLTIEPTGFLYRSFPAGSPISSKSKPKTNMIVKT